MCAHIIHFLNRKCAAKTCDVLLRERGISFSQLSLSQTKPAAMFPCVFAFGFFQEHEKCAERHHLSYSVYLLLLITDQPKECEWFHFKAFLSCQHLVTCCALCQVGSAGAEELRSLSLIKKLLSHAIKPGQILKVFVLVFTAALANRRGKRPFLSATTINADFKNLFHKALLF